jgi:uncharacterized protein (DUF433 family)
MQLEDYFDFLAPLDIRVKGTRVGIETILTEYLENKRTAEEIATEYPALTHEQIYATLTYYWHAPERWQQYLRLVDADYARQRSEQDRNPPPGVRRVKALREELRQQATVSA